jgi:hypothetical protein
MNFKTTYILFGTLVILLLFLLVSQKGAKDTTSTGFVLPSLHDQNVKAKDIQSVEIDRKTPKAEKLVFTRGEHGCRLEQPSIRAQSATVDELVNQVMRAAKEERAADLTSNLEQFGLKDPSTVVTLKGNGKTWQLFLGDQSAGGESNALVYVTSSDLPKEVMAVRRSQLDYLFKNVNDFRVRDLLSEGTVNFPDAATLVKLQSEKGSPVVLEKGDKNRWKFEKPPYGEADEGESPSPAPGQEVNKQTGMKGLLDDLRGLRVESDPDFVADDVTDMAKYGLVDDKPAWLRIEVRRKSGGFGADGDKASDDVLLIGNKTDDKGDKRYARLAGEKTVVRLPSAKIDPIFAIAENPSALRNRDLVDIDQWKADAIDIQSPAGKIELRHAGSPITWKLYQGDKFVAEADPGAVGDLLKALNAKRQVKEFIDNDKAAALGFDKPSAGVSVWLEGIKKDEADKKDEKKDQAPQLKSDKPALKLTFGKKEKDLVYVQRESGNDKSAVAVPGTLLTKVSQDQLAYREKILPSFSETADVLKLTLQRGKETFVLEKTKKDDKAPAEWTFKEPKELVNKKADAKSVDRILGELRRLRTERLVAVKAADPDQYGLKQPQLQATVTIKKGDKETEDFVYQFGKDAPDGLFAKQGQRDMIFVAQPRDLDAVLHAELQDPTVFNFDVGRVSKLVLSGWESLGIGTQTLELKRDAAKTSWVAEKPANFNLDPAQVDSLVKSLSNLQAERFVSRGTGQKPEHKLGPNERTMTIEIALEGDEKNPLTLTLGGHDAAAKAYFAVSSTLPKDVFLVAESRFEKLATQGMKYFSKAK